MDSKKNRRDEPHIKFYVHDEKYITFNCSKCGHTKQVDISKFEKISHKMKIKCKCSAIFKCSIEFRKSYRKNVNLNGRCHDLKAKTILPIKINDISIGGIKITCLMKPNITIGDMVETSFQLDDANRTEIKPTGEVRWVQNYSAGLKFQELRGFQKDLAFYLMR